MTDSSATHGGVTELRVHGVGGSSAGEVLATADVRRVAGNAEAGFYRPRLPGTELRLTSQEAYSWGSLTSGVAARAFWLLLIPFSLVNLAGWARPWRDAGGSAALPRAVERTLLAACRLLALSLTVMLVLAAAGMAMNLLAWQCLTPDTRCAETVPYLGFLNNGWLAALGPRLAVAALLPVAVLVVLWLLGRRTWQRYESFDMPVTQTGEGLEAPGFWRSQHSVGRLRTVHVSVALAAIAALLGYVLLQHDLDSSGSDSSRGYVPIGWGIVALSAAVQVSGVFMLSLPTAARSGPAPRWVRLLLRAMRVAALFSLLAGGVYACLHRRDWAAAEALPGYDVATSGLFLTQLAIVLLLIVVTAFLRRTAVREGHGSADDDRFDSSGPPPPALAGAATPLLAALAVFVGVMFSAGVTYRVTDWLNRGAAASTPASDGLSGPPLPYQWAAFGLPFALLVAVIGFAAIRLWLLPRLVGRARVVTDRDFPGRRSSDPQRARAIDATIGEAWLTDALPRVMSALVLPAMTLTTVLVGLAIVTGTRPTELTVDGVISAGTLATVTGVGTWLIGAAVAALVVVGVQAYRTPRLRRVVGTFWDIATFWPRATHPLAPPCYAERAVPELVVRAGWLAEHGGVILSGHSQGSVLAGAAVLQLPPAARSGTALLTYGSPIRRLYARYFPAYFGPDTARHLAAFVCESFGEPAGQTCRWRNLWRSTDPIGGPMGSEVVDHRLVDPPGWEPAPGDTVAPPIRGHFDYPADAAYPELVRRLATGLDDRA